MRKLTLLLALSLFFGPVIAQTEKDSAAASVKKTADVITQPEFKGGIEKMYEYISTNFQYPEEAQRRSVKGKMEVEFTIEKSGDVTYVGILKGLEESIDEEVLKLLKAMPRWIPATKNGVPVRYKVSMPITIRASRKGQRSSQQLSTYTEN
jgi:TonB family protein